MVSGTPESGTPPAEGTRAAEQTAAVLEAAEREPEAAARELRALAERDPRAALDTLGALARVRTAQAARALLAIADAELPKELRKEARRGLHRLKAAGIDVERPSIPSAPAQPPRQRATLSEAWVTAPDWRGSRLLWLLADRPLGGIYAVGLILSDVAGMLRASVRDTTRKRFQADLERWREEGARAAWLQLPAEYAAQLVGEALALNERSNTPVPHEFQVNREAIEGIARPFESALVYREVSPGAAKLAPDWLNDSAALLREPEMEGWAFDPEAVRPFAEQLPETLPGMGLVTSQSSPERREALVRGAIQKVATPEVRQGLKRRLEEMAYVFLRTDRPRQARLAVGAAVGLEAASASPLLLQPSAMRLDQHPIVWEMMVLSLERGA